MTNSLRNIKHPEEPRNLTVLLICGSTRSPSHTRIGLKEIDGDYRLNNKEIQHRMALMADQLLFFTTRLSVKKEQ